MSTIRAFISRIVTNRPPSDPCEIAMMQNRFLRARNLIRCSHLIPLHGPRNPGCAPSLSIAMCGRFADHCYACHGPDKNAQGGFTARQRTGSHGRPRRLSHSLRANPTKASCFEDQLGRSGACTCRQPSSAKPLSRADCDPGPVDRFGGEMGKHWSPSFPSPPLPDCKTATPANPIDRFVLAGLEKAGLEFSGPADRTLARRLSFDLTGLPPSPKEVDAF